MNSKITIFESNKNDGIMSKNKKFYDSNLSEKEINKIFLQTRINLGKKYGFDGKKMLQAHQKTDLDKLDYPDGKYIVLTEKHMKKDDFWFEDLPADILILESKYKKIVVGNQMADCPILIVEDRRLGVTALSHCGASYINRRLPSQTIEALQKEYNSNVEDLYVYIGSSIKKESYIYDKYPAWATDSALWNDCIENKENNYYIDLDKAIIKQLEQLNIKNIEVSKVNTATSNDYYSYRMASLGDQSKKGQNFVGFYYE